jgi:hypothetical protein
MNAPLEIKGRAPIRGSDAAIEGRKISIEAGDRFWNPWETAPKDGRWIIASSRIMPVLGYSDDAQRMPRETVTGASLDHARHL